MTTLSAANGLAALQRNILVAVTALVVHCAGVQVNLLLRLGGVCVVATVLLCGHFRCGRVFAGMKFVRSRDVCALWTTVCVRCCWVLSSRSRNVRGRQNKARGREHVPYRLRAEAGARAGAAFTWRLCQAGELRVLLELLMLRFSGMFVVAFSI